MSGLLRRIKRSRTAGAGEAPPEGQAAAPEGEPTTPGAPADAPVPSSAAPTSVPTAELPAGEAATAEQPATDADTAEPRREDAAPIGQEPAEPARVPAVPAGQDPVELSVRAPAGRRGRLRRRLRYLRRARELMLRDLGGLFYEIHRTGGGRVDAYATVVNAKIERIAGADAEAHALETALMAPRGDAVVFQPGIGGTCTVCGELYGSSARFCSSCGTAIGSTVHAPTAPAMPEPPPMPPAPHREPEPEHAGSEAEAGDEPTRPLDTPPAAGEPDAAAPHQPAENRPDEPGLERPQAAEDVRDDRTEPVDARNGDGPEQHPAPDAVAAKESGS